MRYELEISRERRKVRWQCKLSDRCCEEEGVKFRHVSFKVKLKTQNVDGEFVIFAFNPIPVLGT